MKHKMILLFSAIMALMLMACPTEPSLPTGPAASSIIFNDGTTVTKTIINGSYQNAITGEGSGAITYESSVPGVATVNASTGSVTPIATGTTVITANKAATDSHTAVSASYTLTITKAASTISFSYGISYTTSLGATSSFTNTVSGEGTGTLSYSSSKAAVATVNVSTGLVTIHGLGTATITVNKAATSTHTAVSTTYTLNVTIAAGTTYQGGKVAYVFLPADAGYIEGEVHGLIASLADLSNGDNIPWAPSPAKASEDIANCSGTAIGTGKTNTAAILLGNGTAATVYAAEACNNYSNTDTGTGVYSDWFLPSLGELSQLYTNRTLIEGFKAAYYWSSTQYNATSANTILFTSGAQSNMMKNQWVKVRAIRTF